MSTNFGTKLTITRPPWKIIVSCFYPPLFSGPRYPTVSFEFFLWRPLLPWQRILGHKLTITRPWWKIVARGFHLHSYYLSPQDPIVMATNRFQDNWLQAQKSVKRWNAAAMLSIAWQWDRYLVPRNVFLVIINYNIRISFAADCGLPERSLLLFRRHHIEAWRVQGGMLFGQLICFLN